MPIVPKFSGGSLLLRDDRFEPDLARDSAHFLHAPVARKNFLGNSKKPETLQLSHFTRYRTTIASQPRRERADRARVRFYRS